MSNEIEFAPHEVEATVKTCTKVDRVVNVQIICDPPSYIYHFADWSHERGSPEWWAEVHKAALKWVDEFCDFIRDHRSQDRVELNVVKDVVAQCSCCGDEWKLFDRDGVTYCAHCGATVEEAGSD